MRVEAINPKYTRELSRLYKADRKYCAMVDEHQIALDQLDPESEGHYKAAARFERKEAGGNDRLVELADNLPARELAAFSKSYKEFHGYTPYCI